MDAAHIPIAEALGITPGVTLRTFGMRRSGNHAIINWLARNSVDGSVFLNNCAAGQPASDSARAIEVNGEWRGKRNVRHMSELTHDAGDAPMLIVSYEDIAPDIDDLRAGLTADLPDGFIHRDLLLYRNFMNWAASLLRKIQQNDDQDALACLRIMMVSLDKYRDLLELIAQTEEDTDVLAINYDRWCARPKYRERVLAALGLPCRDNGLGKVQPYGGGSSFQKGTEEAAELKVSQRWRDMINDPTFQIVLLAASQDDDLIRLMHRLMPQDSELLSAYLNQAQFPYQVEVTE
ncbi:hypothetical protein N6L24_12200 [Cognatishimia sp. SS12]|nr:hypothetical protein [Cognatishimia sp. SS12]